MKSFTASTHLGPVKVHLPDDGVPRVMQNGQTLAEGIPTSYPSANDAPEGLLVCVMQTQWHRRQVNRISMGGDTEWNGLEAAEGRAVFLIPEFGPVWGGRPDERRNRLTGVEFVDGAAVPVDWQIELTPVKRACCGRAGTEQASSLPAARTCLRSVGRMTTATRARGGRSCPTTGGSDMPTGYPGSAPSCSIDGCLRVHYGRGWCKLHYDRWRKWGDPLPPVRSRREWSPTVILGIALLPLTHGKLAVIDAADLYLVQGGPWHAHPHRGNFYAQRACHDGATQSEVLHRVVMGFGPDDPIVDHINHNGLDNRRCNLRPSDNSLNMANRRPNRNTSSRFKGVHRRKEDGKWMASIRGGPSGRYLGIFTDEEEAARAYDAAALEQWGEHALLNFPGDHL